MKFTKNELESLAAGACFLQERLDGRTLFPEEDGREQRLKRWREKAGGRGGEEAFAKRLEAEGLSLEKAVEIAGRAVWNPARALPPWIGELQEMLLALPANEETLKSNVMFDVDSYLQSVEKNLNAQEKLPPENSALLTAVLPFVYDAEQKLIARLGEKIQYFSAQALADMSQILALGLLLLSHKVCMSRLNLFILRRESFGFLLNLKPEDRSRYLLLFKDALLQGGWKELFLEYPVLPRLMVIMRQNWLENMAALVLYLEEDQKDLQRIFGLEAAAEQVDRIQGSISDAHNKGKGVLILTWKSGAKIVYKPRNLGVDTAFKALVSLLEEREFPCDLKTPEVLTGQDHGWVEFIENKPLERPEQAGAYYRRAGALLALVYMLGGNDFHGENMIAHGEYPVLVDLETILSYKMLQFREDYQEMPDAKDVKEAQDAQKFLDVMQESVLGMGFLPIWLKVNDQRCIDFGALTGSIKSSIPSYQGEQIPVFSYQEELADGFSQAYDFFRQNKESLMAELQRIFDRTLLRVILRPTQVYGKMLQHAAGPEFLKDGFLYSVEIERFAPAYLINVEADKVKKIWKLLISEREALETRDIPLFEGRAGGMDIGSAGEILVENYFADSALTRVAKKIQTFGQADKERQLDFIRQALAVHAASCHESGNRVDDARSVSGKELDLSGAAVSPLLLAEAEEIGREIMARAVPIGDKGFAWITYSHELRLDKIMIGQTGPFFYDGLSGIALFMAALAKLTGSEEAGDKAGKLIRPLLAELNNPAFPLPVYRMATGLGNGLGGLLQALLLISDYLEDQGIDEHILNLIAKITPEQIKKEKGRTVLDGPAGLIAPLLTCHSRFGQARALELAVLCGEQLRKQLKAYSDKEKEGKALGFGNGCGGTLYALARLYSVTGNPEICSTIMAMNQGESKGAKLLKRAESINREANNENDRTPADLLQGVQGVQGIGEGQGVPGSLCSGWSGMGLAYLGSAAVMNELQIPCPLEKILRQAENSSWEYGDHYCCGNSGRIDFLLEASMRLERPELLAEARRRALGMMRRKEENGGYQIKGRDSRAISNPSFFQGLSGIGYTLLRCADPQAISSVLL